MSLFSKKQRAPFLRRYLEETPKTKIKNFDELSFTVIDVETTGFELHKDRILSIAALKAEHGSFSVKNLKEWVLFHEKVDVNEAVKVHGILPETTHAGEDFKTALTELVPLLTGAVLVGHHIRFDAAMLNVAMLRYFGIPLKNRLLDTAALTMSEIDAFKKSGYSKQRPPTLDEVCLNQNVAIVDRHTASGDVFTTAQLFLFLTAKMKKRKGGQLLVRDLPIEKL